MNPKYLYLVIDLLTISIPLLASFYPKAAFYKKWKYVGVALAGPAILFLLWDAWFTHIGVWGFNEMYVGETFFLTLPIEEVLFFICIPYSFLFIYFAIGHLVKSDPFYFQQDIISSVLAGLFLIFGACNIEKAYTSIAFILAGVLIAVHLLKYRSRFLGRFYLSFLIVLIPFFAVNGILTGSFIQDEVVWYNNDEIMNLRIGTIPVEDIIYCMLLLLVNVTIYEWLQQKQPVLKFERLRS